MQNSERKIIDGFTFCHELDMLELRLNILDPVIDKFILVEANKTHSNKSKPFYFEENKARFEKFLPKIEHIKLDFDELNLPNSNPWTFENAQRNVIGRGFETGFSDDDLMVVSDVDEIPNPDILQNIKDTWNGEHLIHVFKQKLYYYYLNCRFVEPEGINYIFLYTTRLTTVANAKKHGCHQIRVHYEDTFWTHNAGWHFSFMGNAEFIKQKIESFAHTELDQNHFKDVSNLDFVKDTAKDLFNRSFEWEFCEIDDSYPKYILENQEKYKELIHHE